MPYKADRLKNLRRIFYRLKIISVLPILYGLAVFTSAYAYAAPEQQSITIVYQHTRGFSQQLISHLENDLKHNNIIVRTIQLSDFKKSLDPQETNLILAIGSQTTKTLLDNNTTSPILSLLIPKSFSDALEKTHPDTTNWSCLLIDQPINRHFQLISEIFGAEYKAGILLGPLTQSSEGKFSSAANATGNKISTRYIESPEQLSPALKSLSKETNVLLASPDQSIYNRSTTRGILLDSYRYKLPIIGFSKAYVKAGAIAAIYSKPEQISFQATQLSKRFLLNHTLDNKKYYPDDFSVSLNHKVARSMGIRLPEISTLTKQIKRSEQQP